jgi:hypothetical protein
MNSDLSEIYNRLLMGYDRIVYPVAMGDMPVELAGMAKTDEQGNIVGYYSINELSSELPSGFFVPVSFNNAGTLFSVRWAFDRSLNVDGVSDEQATKTLMLSKGLVDMLDGVKAEEVIIGNLVGNEFGIFGGYEFTKIPKEIIA